MIENNFNQGLHSSLPKEYHPCLANFWRYYSHLNLYYNLLNLLKLWQIKGVWSVGRPKCLWRDEIGQQGTVWTGTAKDRDFWRTVAEGYFLQWKELVISVLMPSQPVWLSQGGKAMGGHSLEKNSICYRVGLYWSFYGAIYNHCNHMYTVIVGILLADIKIQYLTVVVFVSGGKMVCAVQF